MILRLKEEARMDLDIEKQKHQELMAKYQKEKDELLHKKVLASEAKLLWDFFFKHMKN